MHILFALWIMMEKDWSGYLQNVCLVAIVQYENFAAVRIYLRQFK